MLMEYFLLPTEECDDAMGLRCQELEDQLTSNGRPGYPRAAPTFSVSQRYGGANTSQGLHGSHQVRALHWPVRTTSWRRAAAPGTTALPCSVRQPT